MRSMMPNNDASLRNMMLNNVVSLKTRDALLRNMMLNSVALLTTRLGNVTSLKTRLGKLVQQDRPCFRRDLLSAWTTALLPAPFLLTSVH